MASTTDSATDESISLPRKSSWKYIGPGIVVAHVGAGDAFAAGFLSATLRGLPPGDRLRHGHLMAAATLTVAGDLAVPPGRAHADRLAALDGPAWGTLRLGPGWTAATEQDPQDQVEVPTA
ncbi:PfkB family carbohydrate kinase, partial [Streptomyces lunaelactis]|uniref:PfkB family carbohydrate kinase n=1 Tax=Streptomyces lunaelactis TaxID=1535768 RepID=UPI0020C76CB3